MNTTIRERRIPPSTLGPMLASARLRAGLRGREAARLIGISHVHLIHLETGMRCPSMTVAKTLADVVALDGAERTALFETAVDDAGRDFPRRRTGTSGMA